MFHLLPLGGEVTVYTTVDMALAPGGILRGQAHHADGTPAPDVQIQLLWQDSPAGSWLYALGMKTQTDAQGQFTLTGILSGTYRLEYSWRRTIPLPEQWDFIDYYYGGTNSLTASDIVIHAGQVVTGIALVADEHVFYLPQIGYLPQMGR